MSIYRDLRIRKVPTDETRRQGEFLAAAALLVLLKWLPPWASIALTLALVGYFAGLSPRLFPATVRPEETAEGYPLGKIAYAGMVFFLVAFFRHKLFVAAGAWAILAAGDAAATLVGARFPLTRHLWNPGKSLGGTLAFVVAGGLAGFLAVQWVNYPPDRPRRRGGLPGPLHAPLPVAGQPFDLVTRGRGRRAPFGVMDPFWKGSKTPREQACHPERSEGSRFSRGQE